jgi:hypothetical protein
MALFQLYNLCNDSMIMHELVRAVLVQERPRHNFPGGWLFAVWRSRTNFWSYLVSTEMWQSVCVLAGSKSNLSKPVLRFYPCIYLKGLRTSKTCYGSQPVADNWIGFLRIVSRMRYQSNSFLGGRTEKNHEKYVTICDLQGEIQSGDRWNTSRSGNRGAGCRLLCQCENSHVQSVTTTTPDQFWDCAALAACTRAPEQGLEFRVISVATHTFTATQEIRTGRAVCSPQRASTTSEYCTGQQVVCSLCLLAPILTTLSFQRAVECLAILFHIREVLGFSPSQKPAILTKDLRGFVQSFQAKAGIVHYITSRPLPYPFNFSVC